MATLFLTGCVEYGLTVKINKDGSGEIVEDMLLASQIVNMAKAFSSDGDNTISLTEENQKSKAFTFGKGVVFSSFEEIKTEAKEGYKTVYTFTDINDVLISENMFNETIEEFAKDEDEDDEDESDDEDDDNFFRFEYNSRKKGALTIMNGFAEAINKANKEIADDDSDDEENYDAKNIDQELAMAKSFLKGMRFYTKVEFDNIKNSNVPFENNQITLFEIDMDKLLAQPELFKDLMKDGDKEISNFLNNKKKIDGVTFHNFEKITVDFK